MSSKLESFSHDPDLHHPSVESPATVPSASPAEERPLHFAQKSEEILLRRAQRARAFVADLETLYANQVAAGNESDIITLAKTLGVSARSLQRRLKGEGTSHRMLLARARARAAQQLLAASDLTIDAVAKRVGFSERRAFERAFRRWTGKTPASFRRSESQTPSEELHVPSGQRMSDQ